MAGRATKAQQVVENGKGSLSRGVSKTAVLDRLKAQIHNAEAENYAGRVLLDGESLEDRFTKLERDGKPFGRRRVIADEDGVVVPLLVQAGEIAHPFARYPALDQMDRDAFLLGADHTDDSGWHGCFPGSSCLTG